MRSSRKIFYRVLRVVWSFVHMFYNILGHFDKLCFKLRFYPSYTPPIICNYSQLCEFINFCKLYFWLFIASFCPTFRSRCPHNRAHSAPSPIRPLRRSPSPPQMAPKTPPRIPVHQKTPMPTCLPRFAHFASTSLSYFCACQLKSAAIDFLN